MNACRCTCHLTGVADYRQLRQLGMFAEAFGKAPSMIARNFEGVDVRDMFAATLACPECINGHCEAITNPLPLPKERTFYVEPFPPPNLELPPPEPPIAEPEE